MGNVCFPKNALCSSKFISYLIASGTVSLHELILMELCFQKLKKADISCTEFWDWGEARDTPTPSFVGQGHHEQGASLASPCPGLVWGGGAGVGRGVQRLDLLVSL